MNFVLLYNKKIQPPFQPRMTKDKYGVVGSSNFDPEFTGMPINSPRDPKEKRYAPFENFTFDGENFIDDDDDTINNSNDNISNQINGITNQ